MLSHPLATSKCLNSLLRYELAAVRCYSFAEGVVVGPDRVTLAGIRTDHAAAADHIRQRITDQGQTASADPGLWGALIMLAETSATVFGERSILTVLLWSEQHAIETYEVAAGGASCAAAMSATLLPQLRNHAAALGSMIERHRDRLLLAPECLAEQTSSLAISHDSSESLVGV